MPRQPWHSLAAIKSRGTALAGMWRRRRVVCSTDLQAARWVGPLAMSNVLIDAEQEVVGAV